MTIAIANTNRCPRVASIPPTPTGRSGASRRGILTSLVGTSIALGLWAAPAGAAGPPVERFDGIYATCEGLGEIFAVSLPANEHAQLVPTFVLDGGQVLVPVTYYYRLTFTPTAGESQTFVQSASRRAPANATIDTCVAHGTQTTDAGTYELYLEGRMAIRP
jgi:hypothetical protein